MNKVLGKLAEMIINTPQELWHDDKTIDGIIKKLEQEMGKTYPDDVKKKYVKKFKRLAKDPAARSLLPLLLKSGKIDEFLKKI